MVTVCADYYTLHFIHLKGKSEAQVVHLRRAGDLEMFFSTEVCHLWWPMAQAMNDLQRRSETG